MMYNVCPDQRNVSVGCLIIRSLLASKLVNSHSFQFLRNIQLCVTYGVIVKSFRSISELVNSHSFQFL
jgi:hypothetical protein